MNRSGQLEDESAVAGGEVRGTAEGPAGPDDASKSRAPVTLVEKLFNQASSEDQASGAAAKRT